MISWHAVLRSYPCLECGAAPGDPCVTKGGNVKNECHAIRAQNLEHCPTCGDRTYAEGGLCDRCRKVRELELERATYHVRRH